MAITRLNNNSISSITALPSAVAVHNTPSFEAYLSSGSINFNNVQTKIQYKQKIYDTQGKYDTNLSIYTNSSWKIFINSRSLFCSKCKIETI